MNAPRWSRRRTVVALAAALTFILASCGNDGGSTATVATTTTSTTSTTTTTVTSTTTTTMAPAPTALDQLAAFIDAARTLDQQLTSAAAAINGTSPPWHEVTAEVAAHVSVADYTPVGRAIPAGMPADLLRQTILVYSELVSRRMAMNDFGHPFVFGDSEYADEHSNEMLQNLGRGQEAATRFPSDLAELDALANSLPPFEVPPPDSRAQAEVRLIDRYVGMTEGGCDGHGGTIIDPPPEIVWEPYDETYAHFDGKIGGIPFIAAFADTTWMVELWAC